MNNTYNLFFELIQFALGTRICLSHTPSADEWGELYAIAKKQSLVGVCFAGVQRLAGDADSIHHTPYTIHLPEMLYLTWMGMAAKIQQRNEVMDKQTMKALEYFRAKGVACCVLKGQSIAQLYGALKGLRQSGDIDVWLDCDRKQLYELSRKEFGKVEGLTYHHIHYPLFEDAEIELHFWPSFLASPKRNKVLRDFCWLHEPTKEPINPNPSPLTLQDAPLAFNRVYILLHCYRHLCGHGVGLRQVLDYYFVLRQGFSKVEKEQSMRWIERMGMKKFAGAMMWVMQEVFGLESEYLLCDPNPDGGRFLLSEIMHSGNMGHGEDRFDGKISQSAIARYWYNLKRDIRLIRLCPHEALWDPFFNLYQFLWCKKQKTK